MPVGLVQQAGRFKAPGSGLGPGFGWLELREGRARCTCGARLGISAASEAWASLELSFAGGWVPGVRFSSDR